jgi:hypothetical protein
MGKAFALISKKNVLVSSTGQNSGRIGLRAKPEKART